MDSKIDFSFFHYALVEGSSKYYLITHEEEFYTLHISCPEQFTTTSKVNDDNTNIYTRDHKPIKLFAYSSIL